jgi:hypothetical protein
MSTTETIKALTLTQPWASLVQRKAKRIETRSWYTGYRGALVIHAAKGFPGACKDLVDNPYFKDALGAATAVELPLGAGLCVCNLRACVKTSEIWKLKSRWFGFEMTPTELAFGDFSERRYAWLLEWLYDFPEPLPAKGALGLWNWPYPFVMQPGLR